MPSASAKQLSEEAVKPVDLETGIAALEAGTADITLCIDLGGGMIGRADGPHQLDGLLQRARGLRLINMMIENEAADRPADIRSGKSALHPVVEEILDALKPAV